MCTNEALGNCIPDYKTGRVFKIALDGTLDMQQHHAGWLSAAAHLHYFGERDGVDQKLVDDALTGRRDPSMNRRG